MKNLTISLDEQLLAEARAYAHKHGTSLNQLIRKLLARAVKPEQEDWTREFFKLADEVRPDSKGQKWTRDDLHRA